MQHGLVQQKDAHGVHANKRYDAKAERAGALASDANKQHGARKDRKRSGGTVYKEPDQVSVLRSAHEHEVACVPTRDGAEEKNGNAYRKARKQHDASLYGKDQNLPASRDSREDYARRHKRNVEAPRIAMLKSWQERPDCE